MPDKLSPAPAPALDAPVHVEDPFYLRGEDEGIDLRKLLDILARGKWLILATTLAVAIPAAIWTLLQPNRYSSYALLLVEKQSQELAQVLPGGPGGGIWGGERNLANEMLVLRESMPLAQSAADRLVEVRRAPESDAPLTVLEPVETEDGERPPTPLEVAFRLQGGYIGVAQPVPDADAIQVSAQSTSPEEAALIANVYAQAFVDLSQRSSRQGISTSRTFLEEQVSDRGADLERLDAELRGFLADEGAVALDEETSRLINEVADLESRLAAGAVEVQTAEARLRSLRSELARLEPQLSSRVASGADARIEAAQARIRELEAENETYYRRNPEFRTADDAPAVVRQNRAEIARLEGQVDRLSEELADVAAAAGGSGPGDVQSGFRRAAELRRQIADEQVSLDGLRAQQRTLAGQVGRLDAELAAVPRQSIELAQLERQRAAAERTYTALDEKLQEARVAEQSQLGYATIVRPAYVNAVPFAPSRLRNIGLGLFLGLGLGVAAAVARVQLDHRINRPDDLRRMDVPLLGTIPDTTDLIRRELGDAETVEAGGRRIDAHLVALLNPMATASETYRALRTSVQFSRPDAAIRTILVTSANPSEGKSVTAANLAAVLAQSGRRVLLVDADLRRPTVHKKFGVAREPGLVHVLFEEGGLAATVHEVADDFDLLAAGTLAPNPSELLGSKRMREVLAQMHEHYDIVILDAPPVLAATDAVLLSTQADATVVVVRAGSTRDYDLESTLDALRGVGAKVIGTVLNGFDVSKAYGYRYKYAYRYGQDYAYGHENAGGGAAEGADGRS